jgi:hypothetical protein
MAAVGKVTVRKTKTHIVLSDESGQSYSLPRGNGRPLLLDVDEELDLTKPIYEQVQRGANKTKASVAKRRKRHATAA